MMPQNLDAIVSALSGAAGASGAFKGGLANGEDVAAWSEALAMFQSGGESAPQLPVSLVEDNAAALDWLDQLTELNTMLDQVMQSETPIGEELLAELQALLSVLEDSMNALSDPALLEGLQQQVSQQLADLQVGTAQLLEAALSQTEAVDPGPSAQIAAGLRDAVATLNELSEKIGQLPVVPATQAGSLLQSLSAIEQSVRRAGGAEDVRLASAQQGLDSSATAARDAALARLAELTAAAREAIDGKALGKAMPDVTRAVLLAQQFQMGNAAQPPQAELGSANARSDGGIGGLSATAAAPAREPALPPTAQIMGQPGATAGEMRAAAEQAMQRVLWMAAREKGVSQARLQLHPEHLGKVDVKLEVTGREANVVLNVQNGPVREAMEAMLPRLRDQLEQQGINLGDASVFDSQSEDAAPEKRSGAGGAIESLADSGDTDGEEQPLQNELNLRGRGLLDAYA
jgi:flagellar hook-length control protein FliK